MHSTSQAEDRVHRIGQTSAVTARYLLGAGTLDELLWPMLVRKAAVLNQALEGKPGAICLAADAMCGTECTVGADSSELELWSCISSSLFCTNMRPRAGEV